MEPTIILILFLDVSYRKQDLLRVVDKETDCSFEVDESKIVLRFYVETYSMSECRREYYLLPSLVSKRIPFRFCCEFCNEPRG